MNTFYVIAVFIDCGDESFLFCFLFPVHGSMAHASYCNCGRVLALNIYVGWWCRPELSSFS